MIHVLLVLLPISHLAQETTDSLEAKVEMISGIAADSLSRIEAKLKMPGKIAGHLKKIASELAKLAKVLESGFTQVKDTIRSLFTSKCSPSYGGDGYTAIQKHFNELWGTLSEHGMFEVTTKAYSKGLITREVKKTVFSENGTSEGRKADLLLSAIQVRIKTDPHAFDTFVDILRSEPAYQHLVNKLSEQ